jgi:hypothetical protein
MPPTLVSASAEAMIGFVADQGGAAAKPIDGHSGHGVVAVLPGDVNTHSVVEAMTAGGRRVVMTQAGRLTGVNVTSRTGICQLAALTGTRPDHDVLAWPEGGVAPGFL